MAPLAHEPHLGWRASAPHRSGGAVRHTRSAVEAVRFVTSDPALLGEMTLTATFEEVAGGTEVTLAFDHLPPGLRPEDNDAGARSSLQQLARRFESAATDADGVATGRGVRDG